MIVRFVAILCLAGLAIGAASPPGGRAEDFVLRSECPASFERTSDNKCQLRTLYQQYTAVEGFGGLRAPLPTPRDGFSPQEIDLGRYLFFDPALSGDRTISCAHCHDPNRGFADGLGRSHGAGGTGVGAERKGGTILSRGAPSLWNSAFLRSFFWDGHAGSLEEQAEGPLLSPQEMGNSRADLERSINAVPAYRRLFAEAYPSTRSGGVRFAQIVHALAAFQSSLISLNSRYDHYAHGDADALNAEEIAGHNVFRSFVTRCSQCHTPPLFTNGQLAVIGSPEPDGVPFDPGAQGNTGTKTLRAAFKIPSLRNIAETAPYMHSGRFRTLEEVVDFYNGGRGHAVPKGENLALHWHLTTFHLSPDEVASLTAFLRSLSDSSMTPDIPATVPSGLPTIGSSPRPRSPTFSDGATP